MYYFQQQSNPVSPVTFHNPSVNTNIICLFVCGVQSETECVCVFFHPEIFISERGFAVVSLTLHLRFAFLLSKGSSDGVPDGWESFAFWCRIFLYSAKLMNLYRCCDSGPSVTLLVTVFLSIIPFRFPLRSPETGHFRCIALIWSLNIWIGIKVHIHLCVKASAVLKHTHAHMQYMYMAR